jgi:RNA polymerase sigma-70 factor (ECF subfamily)
MTTIDESRQEHALAAAAIQGDDDAFRALYEQLSVRVFNLVLRSVHERATAEDVCQEVWLKAHREIRTLRSPEALRTWLFRMASRACIDYTRSRTYKERGSPEVTEEMLDASSDEPERVVEQRAELRMMWEALAAMPPRQSLALYLKQVEGCSYDEIGRVLSCPTSAVETLLFRARQGFVKKHQELQGDPQRRCKLAGQAMAAVLDHEGTAFQERAMESHVSECRPCRIQLQTLGRAVSGYAWLPMLPVGQQALLAALAVGAGGAGAGIGIGRLVGALLLKAKAASTVAVVIATVGTTAAAAGAAVGVTPTPGEVVAVVQDSVTGQDDAVAQQPQDAVNVGDGSSTGSQGTTPGSNGGAQTAPGALPPAGGIDPAAGPSGGSPDDGLNGGLGGVTDTVDTTLDGVTQLVGDTLETLTDTLNDVLDDPLGAVNDVLQDPLETVNDVVGTADGLVEDTTGTTDETVDNATDAVDDLTGGATDDLTGAVDDTTDGLTDTLDDLLGPPGEEPPPPDEEAPPPDEEEGGCVLIILC